MIGSLLGLAGSVLGSTFAARSQKKANDKNLQLARLQNQWNIEQWQRENAYNTPANQMARLRDAGVNPNLAYANGAPVNVASHSPQMTAGSVNPINYQIPSAGEITAAVNQSELIDSQKKNIDAATEKLKSETSNVQASTAILQSDAAFRDAFNSGQLELQNSQIKLSSSSLNLNEAQTKKIRAEVSNINQATKNLTAEYKKIKAATENLDADTLKKKVDAYCQSKLLVPTIKKMAAEAGLSETQSQDILRTQMYRITGLQLSNDETQTRMFKMRVDADQVQFDLLMDKSFQATERSLGVVTKIVDSSVGALRSFIPFLSKGR